MGLLSNLGVNANLPSGTTILQGVGMFALFIFLFVVIAAAAGGIFYFRVSRKKFNIMIRTFREINGQMAETQPNFDMAMIMTVPNTRVQVLYLKRMKIYLPVGTRRMGANTYYYLIRNNNEWVNFTLANLEKDLAVAGLAYDFQDMRYANSQLKRIIDAEHKTAKWWQTYRNEISVAILIFFLGITFFILIGQIKTVISMLGGYLSTLKELLTKVNELLQAANSAHVGSGVISATAANITG